ncbi:MAG: Gfo/Idh/MocA family protein, partial [bacterium]
NKEAIMPVPILVGRNPATLKNLTKISGIERWTTNLDDALSDSFNVIYFDSQTSDRRYTAVKRAIAASKHIYCEKPTALTFAEAYELYRLAQHAGIKHGVVQDKLWLPGILKLKLLKDMGFFGQIYSVRGEFGYWVFEGDKIASQRPSWNYKKEKGGGIILDMFPHWRYLLDNLFGNVQAVSCLGATHVQKRWDEDGKPYHCTADDSAYATFKLEGGIIAHFNSSWVFRVRRDDLLTIQVDGSKGSAVAGLRNCWSQSSKATPRPVWNPDLENPINYLDQWKPVQNFQKFDNAFKVQWELFLRHVVKDEPFPWNLLAGAKGIQLAEKAHESWQKKSWVEIPELKE